MIFIILGILVLALVAIGGYIWHRAIVKQRQTELQKLRELLDRLRARDAKAREAILTETSWGRVANLADRETRREYGLWKEYAEKFNPITQHFQAWYEADLFSYDRWIKGIKLIRDLRRLNKEVTGFFEADWAITGSDIEVVIWDEIEQELANLATKVFPERVQKLTQLLRILLTLAVSEDARQQALEQAEATAVSTE